VDNIGTESKPPEFPVFFFWVDAFVQILAAHFRRLLHRIMHRFLKMVFRGREIVTARNLWRVAIPVADDLNRVPEGGQRRIRSGNKPARNKPAIGK
jgi:hypothetical protein